MVEVLQIGDLIHLLIPWRAVLESAVRQSATFGTRVNIQLRSDGVVVVSVDVWRKDSPVATIKFQHLVTVGSR